MRGVGIFGGYGDESHHGPISAPAPELIVQGVYALREKSASREKSKVAPARPRKPRKNLADFLLESPFAGSELDLERQQDYGRPVEL